MSQRRPFVLAALIWGGSLLGSSMLSGCSATNAADDDQAPRAAAQPWEVDPYSRTEEIFVDGTAVGYLVSYDAIPDGTVLQRAMPTGSYRIQDRRFEDVGFISPRGLVFRHSADGAQALGFHPLEEGLLNFFGGRRQVKLVALRSMPAKVVAPAADEAGADGEAAAEDGEVEGG